MSTTSDLCSLTCRTCGVIAPEAWDDVPADVLGALNRRKTIRRVPKGCVLFHEGDAVTALFRLLSGVVLLRKGDREGNSVVTRMVTAYTTLGFRAFAAGECHSVAAHCASEAVVCRIPADAAELAFASNRTLERAFALHVAHELTYVEDAVLAQMRLSVRERLLLLLAQMAERFGEAQADGSLSVPLPILRSDIAAMIGIARETFSRCVHRIEAEGLLRFHGNRLHVPDPVALAAAAAAIRAGGT